MRWEDERYVRVYTRDTAEWLALGWEAQALFLFLLRVADRAGIIPTGRAGIRGLAGLTRMPLEVVERAAPILLEDGCLRAGDGCFIIPNFIVAQEARTSDAQRKRDQRDRDRAKALADGATGSKAGLDTESQMVRRVGQHVTQGGHTVASHTVTSDGHSASQHVTPSLAVPSRAEPCTASQATDAVAPLAAGQAETESQRPDLVLVEQPGGKPRRRASKAEQLYAKLEADRAEACKTAGVPFVPEGWPPQRQNKQLGPVANGSEAEQGRFADAWDEWLAEPGNAAKEPPFSLGFFLASRSTWETRALKRNGGAA